MDVHAVFDVGLDPDDGEIEILFGVKSGDHTEYIGHMFLKDYSQPTIVTGSFHQKGGLNVELFPSLKEAVEKLDTILYDAIMAR